MVDLRMCVWDDNIRMVLKLTRCVSGFSGLEVACWPLRTQVRGVQTRPKPSDFHFTSPSFGREVNLWVPCRRFTACKRSLNETWKSGIFRLNLPAIYRPHISYLWLLGSLEDD
jgi:hypothetical protein